MPPQTGAPAQLNVIYAGFNFNDTNGILIDAADDIYEAYHSGEYSFEFTLRVINPSISSQMANDVAADIGTFRGLLTALVNACRVPRGRLRIQYGGVDQFDWNPALGAGLTAFHTRARLEPLSSEDDSLTSKRFRLTLTFDHPASLAGQDGRQDSNTGYEVSIRGRRTVTIDAAYTALTSSSALAQYQASTTDTWFLGQLPANVAGGEWELVSETPSWDDEGGTGGGGRVLNVRRVYFEAINGLRDWNVTKELTPSQKIFATVSGTYIPTLSNPSAKAAHDADVGTFVANTLTALFPGKIFDAKPLKSSESKTTVDGLYPFSLTFEQIITPQAPGVNDDPNVAPGWSLAVSLSTPFDSNTLIPGVKPQSLQTGVAIYSAPIDVNSAGGQALKNLWDSKYRQHCLNTIKGQLGASSMIVRLQDLGLDPTENRIAARLTCIVWNSNVLSLVLSEQLEETPAGNPVPMAVSNPHEYFLFWGTARLVLTRIATCEFVVGTNEPDYFKQGNTASGVGLTDTGWASWEAARSAVNGRTFKLAAAAAGTGTQDKSAPKGGGWYPLSKSRLQVPKTVGQDAGLQTNTGGVVEKWLFMSALNQGPAGAPSNSNATPTFSGLGVNARAGGGA